MFRTLAFSAFAITLLAISLAHAQNQGQSAKDVEGAVQAMRSNNPVDRASGLYYLYVLSEPGRPYTRDVVNFLFDGNADVRKWASMALGNVNPQLAAPVLTVVQGTDYNAKVQAMQQLAAMGNNGGAAMPAMLSFLQQAKSEDKATLIKDVTAVGSKDATVSAVLAKIAVNDPDPSARNAAFAAIPQLQNKQGALDVFMGTLTNSSDPGQRAGVIFAIAKMGQGNPLIAQVLQNAIKDPSPTVRAAAQQAMEDMKKQATKR